MPDVRRRRLVIAVAALVATPSCALADLIPLNHADVRVEDGEVLLSTDFDLSLNATLEEALQRGVPLYFVLEAEVLRPRRWWFDGRVASHTTQYRVSFQPLTRQYRVASGLLAQNFDSLQEVERFIGRVNARTIARVAELDRGSRYDVVVRLRLDANQLPKPFQLNALASSEWKLASETRRIPLTP
ncbi:MAG TPA: DUF4390 domain-containing protein [Casimicrobiaceae bacterium]|nr:DUF4390 domain-containing protein [Casimicrobiaceae bacterium]